MGNIFLKILAKIFKTPPKEKISKRVKIYIPAHSFFESTIITTRLRKLRNKNG